MILRLLPPLATLATQTVVSLFQLMDKLDAYNTIVDEVLAFCAVVLLCCYPINIWAAAQNTCSRLVFGANGVGDVFSGRRAAGPCRLPHAFGFGHGQVSQHVHAML